MNQKLTQRIFMKTLYGLFKNVVAGYGQRWVSWTYTINKTLEYKATPTLKYKKGTIPLTYGRHNFLQLL